MQCPKHGSKMTLLLTSYVCDECDPPKQVQVKPPTPEQRVIEALFPRFGTRPPSEVVMERYTGYQTRKAITSHDKETL